MGFNSEEKLNEIKSFKGRQGVLLILTNAGAKGNATRR